MMATLCDKRLHEAVGRKLRQEPVLNGQLQRFTSTAYSVTPMNMMHCTGMPAFLTISASWNAVTVMHTATHLPSALWLSK